MVVRGHIHVVARLRQLTRLGDHVVFAKGRKETGMKWVAALEKGFFFEDEIIDRSR